MSMIKSKIENIDMEKLALTVGMTFMEAVGAIMLLCALFDIRII